MRVSVIIPVLNERACLPSTVEAVRRALPEADVVIVDGGSTDGSREWAASRSDIALLDSVRGKGPQLNAGAAYARGDVLLFLHADTQLPANACYEIDRSLADPCSVGGGFFVRFAERKPFSLRILAIGMNVRVALLRRCFGDQALFVRRRSFEQFGGFPDWPLFEDYELVRRMKKCGQFAVITSPVTLSARRFLVHGVWRTVIRVFVLQAGFYLGVSPSRLTKWFVDVRPHLGQTAGNNSNLISQDCEGGRGGT